MRSAGARVLRAWRNRAADVARSPVGLVVGEFRCAQESASWIAAIQAPPSWACHRHRPAHSVAKERSPSCRAFSWSARRAGFAVTPMTCLLVGRPRRLFLLWWGLPGRVVCSGLHLFVVRHDVFLLGARRRVGRDRAGDRTRYVRAGRWRLMACGDPLGAQEEHYDDRPDECRRGFGRHTGAGRV